MTKDNSEAIEYVGGPPSNADWVPRRGPVSLALSENLLRNKSLPDASAAGTVIDEAYNVLAKCVPPTASPERRTGLVCGYVQSGKTMSMTAVSALARDNRFRIVIFFSGVTTNLLDQNRERLEQDLRAATASQYAWHMVSNPRAAQERGRLESLVQEWSNPDYPEEELQTLLITVMKNHRHLENLAELLKGIDLSRFPALVFDDEADQASLNTRPSAPDASTTYRNIAAVRAALPHHTYLQYTATPQAPLLITRIDSLSADFAELVSPGADYTGGAAFFGGPQDHIRTIPPTDIFSDRSLPDSPPHSLIEALQAFFIGVAIGRCEQREKPRSMLIHPSHRQATHDHYHSWTTTLKESWYRVLLRTGDPDRDELVAEFRKAYADVQSTATGELPTFEEVLEKLPIAVSQTRVWLVNSAQDGDEVDWKNCREHILVGGDKLSRGYTVRGITVTYMPRTPGGWTADTIQQRARFFGYHRDYLGLCRVYLHGDVRRAYEAYLLHEEDMRERLRVHGGMPLTEWRRLFFLDRRLAPTRKNVLLTPYLRPRLTSQWFAPRAPHVSPDSGQQNRALVRRLNALTYEDHAVYPQHKFAAVRLEDVYRQLLVPLSYLDEEDAVGLVYVNCNLRSLLDEEPDARCVIFQVRSDTPSGIRKRTLTARGEVEQLFEGRRASGGYPGDREIHDPIATTVQIHMLRLVNRATGEEFDNVPAVAVRLTRERAMLVHDE